MPILKLQKNFLYKNCLEYNTLSEYVKKVGINVKKKVSCIAHARI